MLSLIFSLGGWLQETASTSPSALFISPQTRVHGLSASLVKTCYQLLDITDKTSRCLGRESELVRVCCYLFDPMFYEANESSSACSPELRQPVETRTPPFWSYELKLVPPVTRLKPQSRTMENTLTQLCGLEKSGLLRHVLSNVTRCWASSGGRQNPPHFNAKVVFRPRVITCPLPRAAEFAHFLVWRSHACCTFYRESRAFPAGLGRIASDTSSVDSGSWAVSSGGGSLADRDPDSGGRH